MSYVCYNNDCFIFLDASIRGGLFCKFFYPSGKVKSYTLQPSSTSHYSMALGTLGEVNIVSVYNGTSLYLYNFIGSQLNKKLIASAPEGGYFIHPYIYLHNNSMNIIYISYTNGSEYSIYHQNLEDGTPHLIGTLSDLPLEVRYMTTHNCAYISYINPTEPTNINIIKVDPSLRSSQIDVSTFTLFSHSDPITDYSLLVLENTFHISYVIKKDDIYNLYYKCGSYNLYLSSSNSPISPTIFYYLNGIWVNSIIDNKLYTMLSMNMGKSFSIPVLSTFRTNPKKSTFIYHNLKYLSANELYVCTDHSFKLCTISSIDFEGFHPNMSHPVELDLLLEAFLLHTCNEKNCPKIGNTNNIPITSNDNYCKNVDNNIHTDAKITSKDVDSNTNTISSTYQSPSDGSDTTQTIDNDNITDKTPSLDIETATKNFMGEFSSFSISPKLK